MSIDEDLKKKEKEMALVGMMTAGVVHEIKTPLTLIQGIVGQLNQLILQNDLDIEKLERIGGKLEKLTQTMIGLIRSVQSLTHDVQTPPSPTNLSQILDEVVEMCSEKLRLRNTKLHIHYYDRNLKILCHPLKITQVLINLINNSIDALLQLPKKEIDISIEAAQDNVIISVKDSGSIPEAIRNDLFKPLFTTKKRGEGTGLGLYLCQELLKINNGSIELDKNSEDTCFIIRIPIAL